MLPWTRPTLFESAETDKRTGSASEALSRDEKVTEMSEVVGNSVYQIQVDAKLAEVEKEHKFDKEANKDLENHERRGVEAGLDWKNRRAEGMPPRNERDSKDSKYSLQNIEEGLLVREAADGIEYGVYWDADGELVGINKGEKGQVMSYVPRDENGKSLIRGGTFTHTHPSDLKDNRQLGLSFSKGDIENHGSTERAETRAVAREGTYSLRGTRGFIPKDELDKLKNHSNPNTRAFAARYERETDPWERNRMAAKILALKIDLETDNLVYNQGASFNHNPINDGRWFSSAKFATLMAVAHKDMAKKFGYEYEFKAKAGFEQMEKIVSGRFNPSDAASELAKMPARPDVIVRGEFPKPTGIAAIDRDGNTIRTPRPAVATATQAPASKAPRRVAPKPAPSKPASAPAKATRVAKPKKPTDIKPPPAKKAPAVKIPPTFNVGSLGGGSGGTSGGFLTTPFNLTGQ